MNANLVKVVGVGSILLGVRANTDKQRTGGQPVMNHLTFFCQ